MDAILLFVPLSPLPSGVTTGHAQFDLGMSAARAAAESLPAPVSHTPALAFQVRTLRNEEIMSDAIAREVFETLRCWASDQRDGSFCVN